MSVVRLRHAALITLGLMASTAMAQTPATSVKIGVLSDMSSLYADTSGPGSVVAARLAVEDFNAAAKGLKVEVVGGDHQNKADVGASIVRQWYDQDSVDVIVDVPNSAVALAVGEISRDKTKSC